MENFHSELDNLRIRWPGGSDIHFSDDQKLKELVKNQYPDWKLKGKVTSIPAVRVPSMFLGPEMMSERLNKQYERIQKGEEGELKVYRIMRDGFGADQTGIVILPNLDTNGLFKSKLGLVEIDMIVLHPSKGIFIVSVKNRKMGEQKPGMDSAAVKEFEEEMKEKLKREMLKHRDFIMQLSNYKTSPCSSSSSLGFIPVHAVFCQLSWSSENMQDLEINKEWYTYNDTEHVLMFQKPDFLNFQKRWSEKVSKICDIEMQDHFETMVARLVALSSMDSATALIHDKMISNSLQSIQVKQKDLNTRLDQEFADTSGNVSEDSLRELKNVMQKEILESNRNQSKRGKMKVILWTKEQLEIIAEVYETLTCNDGRVLRMNVEGPKGSGKTMLLIYLAKLAQAILDANEQKSCKQVFICDGSFEQLGVLFAHLRKVLDGSKVVILKDVAENIADLEGIIFLDEADPLFREMTIICEMKKNHVCLFTSARTPLRYQQSFNVRTLSYNLRSTIQLSQFCNSMSSVFELTINIKGKCAHNLEGEQPDIVVSPPGELLKVCLKTITKYSQGALDAYSTLVSSTFLSTASDIALHRLLTQHGIKCFSQIDLRCNDKKLMQNSNQICLLHEGFTGAEFGTVILPLEASCRRPIGEEILNVITRATMRLVVIVEQPECTHLPRELARSDILDYVEQQ